MNITLKQLAILITALLAGLASMSSCSKKEPEMTIGKKGKMVPVAKMTKANKIPSDEKNTLVAVRKGQTVELNWRVGASVGKITQVYISRSPTGVSGKKRIAELPSDAVSFKDNLPDENAYWYWVRLVTADDKFQEIGPARVDIDRAGASRYIKQADLYPATVTRTDALATIMWDFPEGEYSQIKIVRASRPVPQPFRPGKSTQVLTAMERKSQCDDALPSPHAEYWYWFQITLKSGEIIYKGPIRAEHPGRSAPAPKSGKASGKKQETKGK